MGLFKRLRAASSSRKPPESTQSQANTSASTVDGSVASARTIKRSPSSNLLSVPDKPAPPPRVSTSSTVASTSSLPGSARSSMLPWKKDKRRDTDELQSIPYETTSASPLSGSGAHPSPSPARSSYPRPLPATPLIQHIPTIANASATQSSRPSPSSRPPPRSPAYHTSPPPSPSSPTAERTYHARNPSHESSRTVVSLNSTLTGRSRRTSDSQEWRRDGGVLGKFVFESGDWGAISAATPFQSPPSSSAPSKHTTPGASPSKLTLHPPTLVMSATPKSKPAPKDSGRPTIRKLGASHTSPSLPSVSTFSNNPLGAHSPEDSTHAGDWPPVKQQERADVTELQGKDKARDVTVEAKKAPTPPKEMVTDLPKDEVEEIFSSTSEPDLDERRRFWKPGMRTRRTSRSRPVEDRPVSMSHVEPRPPLRRPPSSLFHIPFGRTQSRVSLAFDDQPSHADDGSFQLKSFRHISGASDAEGGFSQYLSLAKNDDRGKSGQDRQTSDSTIIPLRSSTGAVSPLPPPSPTAIPRPRPPSAAGSDSSQRVSVAAFRKGVRRPSSSVLLDDDDDDVPLSLSRAQIFESAGLRRDSGSALSLTDHPSPPARPKRALPPTPLDNARSDSPSPIGLGPPPAMRATNPSSPALGFAVKGPRRILDDAKDAKMQNTFGERLPSPSPVLAPIVTSSPKVIRPPRASSLTVAAEDGLGIWTPPILSTSPDGQASTVMSPTVMSPTATSTRSPSQSPPPPARLRIPEPQANMEELMIKLPPRPDELHDEATPRDSPHRGATLSPSFSMPFDEPLRRISGLWSGGTPDLSSDKEEGFNPTLVESTLRDSQRRSDSNHENRQSLYDRLAVAASAATSSVVSALPTTTSSEERLYIPPVRTPSPPPIQAQSPTSERTASPIPVPPAMELPPAPVPPMPHSSFGRVPRRAAEKPAGPRAGKSGWASSSDDEDDDERRPRPRPATSASTATTRTMVAARPQPAAPRPQSSAILRGKVDKIDKVEIISDSDEDEPLKVLKTSRSRSDLTTSRSRTDLQLRPAISRSSHSGSSLQKPDEPARPTSILKPTLTGNGNGHANGHANGPVTGRRSRTTSMHNGTAAAVTPSASKWSLSSSPNDSPESDPMSPPVRPISRPNSRHAARPISRVSIARDSSADPSRPMPRTASTDQMPKLGRPKSAADLIPRKHSSDRLRAGPQSTTKMHAPSPRHGPIAMVAVNDARPTASPASSQSGLTGDSSGQQPMTPRSVGDPSRRSWADGRLRPDAETASVRARPASQFDWASGPPPSGAQFPYPGMDPYGQQTVYKQQIQAQWMAAAQRHFEDMWERASSVSNAQTAPHGSSANMFQPTYGYSYSQPPPMPPMPQMPYGGYGQYPPYGGYGGPQVAFPGGMPGGMPMGMPGMAGAMPGMPGGMPGMPMGGGGYAYGPGVQSVYGGEFGPPVAPGMRETAAPGSPGGSPSRQRARRTSGVTEGGRPASIAHNLPSSSASVIGVPASHYSQQRATPPRRPGARRSSGLALSEVGGPPSSWRLSAGDELDTPRAKRVTNAS